MTFWKTRPPPGQPHTDGDGVEILAEVGRSSRSNTVHTNRGTGREQLFSGPASQYSLMCQVCPEEERARDAVRILGVVSFFFFLEVLITSPPSRQVMSNFEATAIMPSAMQRNVVDILTVHKPWSR